MKEISFYDYGLEDIFCGRKSSTLRFEETGFSAGEIVKLVRQNGQFVGYLKLLSVKEVKFSELSETDAFIENWESLSDLKSRLQFSYNSLTPNDVLIRITFCYLRKVPEVLRKNSIKQNEKLKSITIVTESSDKFERYSYIFEKFFNLQAIRKSPKTIEGIFENSCEQRAKDKLISSEDAVSFATDDMATISLLNEVVHVPNMKDLKRFISQIEHEKFRITVRTGMALQIDGVTVTHPVLRTFSAIKADYNKLNEILYLDETPLSQIETNDQKLIQPLIHGITVLLQGGL